MVGHLALLRKTTFGQRTTFASSKSTFLNYFINFNNINNMKATASASLRQASRLCSRQPVTALSRSSALRVAGISQTSRREYVSETPKNNASVNVDTTIRADQKAFFQETGKLPENHIVPGTNVEADAMMSPMAGKSYLRLKVASIC